MYMDSRTSSASVVPGRLLGESSSSSSSTGTGVGSSALFKRDRASYAPWQNLAIRGEHTGGGAAVNISLGYIFQSSVAHGKCSISRNGPMRKAGQHCFTTVTWPRMRYIQSRRNFGSGTAERCESPQILNRRDAKANPTRSDDPAKTSWQLESDRADNCALKPWIPYWWCPTTTCKWSSMPVEGAWFRWDAASAGVSGIKWPSG